MGNESAYAKNSLPMVVITSNIDNRSFYFNRFRIYSIYIWFGWVLWYRIASNTVNSHHICIIQNFFVS